MMGADEEGTHERLKAHLRELVNPKIKEHSGRIVKNTGDGFLAEFSSVVVAVRCAVEIQRAMADRNADTIRCAPKQSPSYRFRVCPLGRDSADARPLWQWQRRLSLLLLTGGFGRLPGRRPRR